MRTVFVVACILVALTANAQPPPAESSLEAQRAARVSSAISRAAQEVEAGELVKGNVIYSGIVVGLLTTGSPFHLSSAPAPPLYGPLENGTLRDWSKGPVSGFTLFSISF